MDGDINTHSKLHSTMGPMYVTDEFVLGIAGFFRDETNVGHAERESSCKIMLVYWSNGTSFLPFAVCSNASSDSR